jgi:UDP-glucuronate 4-epimerase
VKILVTGAAGFIGMTPHFPAAPAGARRRGRRPRQPERLLRRQLKENRLARLTAAPGFRFVKLDVADRAGMEKLFAAEKFDRSSTSPPRPACAIRCRTRTPTSTATWSAS